LNGVTSFHPDDFYTKDTDAKGGHSLRIAAFRQFDAEQNILVNKTSELATTETICMMPEDRYINLQLALLNFRETELNQYIWRVKGWSDTWQVQTQPEIQLSKLPYGDYDLEIRARTAKGELAANEINLKVEVVPPFYKTWVFIVIVVLSVLGLTALFLVLRFRQLRKTQEKLERKVKEATRELRELDSLKTRLFANVSHEFRTPLTLILGPISSVLKRKKIADKDAELLQLALHNGQGLEHLITEILDLGKLESGKLSLKEAPIHLGEAIQKVAASFHAAAENKGLQFYFKSEIPENAYLRCDRHLVEKILNNLLSNAVKFTPENGVVHFSVTGTPDSELIFEVKDTGKGIHKEDLPYIFDRYYQAKKGGEQLTGGTGIGLSLSKELAALMGGTLHVQSELGRGSTFIFSLPWIGNRIVSEADTPPIWDSTENEAVQSSQEKKPVSAPEGDKISILVTEDNADLRHYLRTLLEPLYHVTLVRHGKEALAFLEKTVTDGTSRIDMIVTDLMMPEMDGFGLLEALRSRNEFSLMPVIMLTARTGISDRLRALRLGVHDYLTKPFEEDELLARIDNLSKWAKERKIELAEKDEGQPAVFSHEEAWMQEVESWLAQHFKSAEIKVIDWAISLNLSESQFRRKLKQATGLTPQQYLQEYRLKEARKLLENQIVSTVAEAAYEVGFSAADYFSKVFQKRFGKRPSQYLAA
jgi:signal transduction histidine kinase/DNA-binding response OmpR family regulator